MNHFEINIPMNKFGPILWNCFIVKIISASLQDLLYPRHPVNWEMIDLTTSQELLAIYFLIIVQANHKLIRKLSYITATHSEIQAININNTAQICLRPLKTLTQF